MEHNEAQSNPESGEGGAVTINTIVSCASLLRVTPAALIIFLVGEL